MSYLRLYRDFYCIEIENLNETYIPINVFDVSANVIIRNTNQTIESPNVIFETLGKYYVDLTAGLYSIDETYEINWLVKYTAESPLKKLITRFKLVPIVVGQNVDIRLETNEIRLEIIS
jgi:hypothetical protein